MSGRPILLAVLAFFAGIFVAVPLALMLAGRGDAPDPPRAVAAPGPAQMREVYSPHILGDPYFIEEQRKNVEALRRHCNDTGESCAEAEALREWLAEHAAGG